MREDAHNTEFEEFFREYFTRIKDFAVRMGVPDPDEIAQETLTRVLEGWDTVDRDQPWVLLYVIARNLARDAYRKRRSSAFREITPADLRAARRDSPEERALLDELTREVHRAMGRLSVADRDLIRLRVWDGLSHRELAARYGVGESAVRQRYSRALKRLAVHIGKGGLLVLPAPVVLAARRLLVPSLGAATAAAVVLTVGAGGPARVEEPPGERPVLAVPAFPASSQPTLRVRAAVPTARPSPSGTARVPVADRSAEARVPFDASVDVPPPDPGPGRKESHHIEVPTALGNLVVYGDTHATGHALDPACRSGVRVCG